MTETPAPYLVPRTLTLELPLPPRGLFPNVHHAHWAPKAKLAAQYKSLCWAWAMLANKEHVIDGQPLARAVLAVTFECCTGRRVFDPDNGLAALKSGIDGVVTAGILQDDSAACVQYGEVKVVRHTGHLRDFGCQGRTMLMITEVLL